MKIAMLLPLGLMAVACVKTPEINKDFGPENSAEQINQALEQAQQKAIEKTVYKIKPGEFSYYVKTNQIENLFPVVYQQTADTVFSKDANENRVKLTLTHQLTELQDNGQLKPWPPTQKIICVLELKPDGCLEAQSNLQTFFHKVKRLFSFFNLLKINFMSTSVAEPKFKTNQELPPAELTSHYKMHMPEFADLKWRSVLSASGQTAIRWTFHNLKVQKSAFPVPELVLMREDCGKRDLTLKKCSDPLETIEVFFEQVDWTTEPNPVKYSYKFIFSPEVPYLGAQLQSCGATSIPYQDQRLAIMQCESLKDFTFGHD